MVYRMAGRVPYSRVYKMRESAGKPVVAGMKPSHVVCALEGVYMLL